MGHLQNRSPLGLIFIHHFHFHISMAQGPRRSEKLISPQPHFHFNFPPHTHTHIETYFPTNRKAKSQPKTISISLRRALKFLFLSNIILYNKLNCMCVRSTPQAACACVCDKIKIRKI